ncbi:hypothetical protein SFC43_25550 [Bacteroides sp. CR5/BHMF/2]|nr:hypothetical protein [Bacteroides sp. CR5/BHMF/2]
MKTTIKYMILLCCACLMSNCNNDLYDSPRGALTISSTTVTAGSLLLSPGMATETISFSTVVN